MIIVAGALRVDPARTAYLDDCHDLIEPGVRKAASTSTPDPLEHDRINIFEQWESVAAVEAFRGSGPSGAQQDAIRGANVWQHEIGSSTKL